MIDYNTYSKCLLKLKIGDEVIFYIDHDGYCSFAQTKKFGQAKIIAKNGDGIPILGIRLRNGLRSFWLQENSGETFLNTIENYKEYRYCFKMVYGDLLVASVVKI